MRVCGLPIHLGDRGDATQVSVGRALFAANEKSGDAGAEQEDDDYERRDE